MDVLWEVKTN